MAEIESDDSHSYGAMSSLTAETQMQLDLEHIIPDVVAPSSRDSDTSIDTTNGAAARSNFLHMAFAFSLNHGTVVTLLAYASTVLPTDLAGQQSGTLYCTRCLRLTLSMNAWWQGRKILMYTRASSTRSLHCSPRRP